MQYNSDMKTQRQRLKLVPFPSMEVLTRKGHHPLDWFFYQVTGAWFWTAAVHIDPKKIMVSSEDYTNLYLLHHHYDLIHGGQKYNKIESDQLWSEIEPTASALIRPGTVVLLTGYIFIE